MAYVAHRALGDRMTAALADSSSLSRREYRSALAFAEAHDIPLRIVHTDEMADPFYVANQGDRCYHCKKALFEKLGDLQDQMDREMAITSWPICYGVNLDDLGDHRPGIQAGREASILTPYVDLGIDKQMIRAMCRHYQLDIAEKPAMPCMSSRISYGVEVTEERLKQIEQAEDLLHDLGFSVFRVRHHDDTARIEMPPEDFPRLLEHREQVAQLLQGLGFVYVSLDLSGFRSGSLNAVLSAD